MQNLDWNDLRYVLAVARSGKLATAAKLLGVDATTVSRRIRAAETTVGAQLVERLPDGTLQPTPAGQAAAASAEQIEGVIARLMASIADADVALAGTVRVTSVPVLVNHVLVPASGMLAARYPKLRLELIADSRNLSLIRREADLALRLARPAVDAGGVVLSRRIGALPYAIYVAANYPADAEGNLPWVGYEEGMTDLPHARWMTSAAQQSGGLAPIAFNDAEAVIQAVRTGLGRSLLPRVVGDRDDGLRQAEFSNGSLPLPVRELWLLMHPDARPLARVKAVVEWIESIFVERNPL